MSTQQPESLLGPYRVLDLTDEKGLFCGKLFGDLGADVIKVEKPGGDPARNIGPFYRDVFHPERSLFWFALNLNKRGTTLDIETADGKEIFNRLVRTADFVIESFEPGYMDNLGLGYSTLEEINPRIILVSITPFGQTGPYARYKASDIVAWAAGGELHVSGDPEQPPVRVSFPQAYLNAGAAAVVGAMAAHYHRELTGEGQWVDVSAQACVTRVTMEAVQHWDVGNMLRQRGGATFRYTRPEPLGPIAFRAIWPCKDGHICWVHGLAGGAHPGFLASTKALMEMADRDGMAGDLKDYDWTKFDTSTIPQEELDHQAEILGRFFLSKTTMELYEEAVKKEMHLAPLCTSRELAENPHLAAREAWENVEHPELGDAITYPGAWAKLTETPLKLRRRAPLIGEHNEDIYEKELGLSKAEMAMLKASGVI